MRGKSIVAVVCAVALAGGAAVFFVPWESNLSSFVGCENEIISEVKSPDGEHRAVIFVRDCGATTMWSSQVSILRLGQELPNLAGNAFVQPGHPRDTHVSVVWNSRDELQIRYEVTPSFGPPTTIEGKVGGVTIKALPLEPLPLVPEVDD